MAASVFQANFESHMRTVPIAVIHERALECPRLGVLVEADGSVEETGPICRCCSVVAFAVVGRTHPPTIVVVVVVVADVAGCSGIDGSAILAPALRCIVVGGCRIGRGMRLLQYTSRGTGETCLFLIRA